MNDFTIHLLIGGPGHMTCVAVDRHKHVDNAPRIIHHQGEPYELAEGDVYLHAPERKEEAGSTR